jgi:hypothetical protein
MSDCCSVNGTSRAPAVGVCPMNGARSKQVDMLTVKSLVRQLPLGMPHTQYYFCEAQDCDVVYFTLDAQAPIFRRADLLVRVGVKENADPIQVCYCFGFTRGDIHNEIAETGHSTIGRADYGGSKSRQLCVRSEKPLGQMLPGQRHARKSRLSTADRRSQGRKVATNG